MKKITYFTIQFRLKKLIHFRNLNSFEIKNNMLPKHSQKTFSVYKFSSKHVSLWCQKKHLHCTIFWRSRTTSLKHFKSKMSVYISLSKFLFQRRSKILPGGMGDWGSLNNFFKAARCLGALKCFPIFHFNWNFAKFNYFSVLRYSHQ